MKNQNGPLKVVILKIPTKAYKMILIYHFEKILVTAMWKRTSSFVVGPSNHAN